MHDSIKNQIIRGLAMFGIAITLVVGVYEVYPPLNSVLPFGTEFLVQASSCSVVHYGGTFRHAVELHPETYTEDEYYGNSSNACGFPLMDLRPYFSNELIEARRVSYGSGLPALEPWLETTSSDKLAILPLQMAINIVLWLIPVALFIILYIRFSDRNGNRSNKGKQF